MYVVSGVRLVTVICNTVLSYTVIGPFGVTAIMNPLILLLEGIDQLILILVLVRTVMNTSCGLVEGAIMNTNNYNQYSYYSITNLLILVYHY